MKRFLTVVCIIFLFSSQAVFAKTLDILVETKGNKVTVSQDSIIELLVISEASNKKINIEKDSILEVKVKKIIPPKKPKRNGYIKIREITYIPSAPDKEKMHFDNSKYKITLKNYNPTDYGKLAKSAGIMIIGKVASVPGMGQAFALLEGIANPIYGKNRLESGAIKVYQSIADPIMTAISYTKKGQTINLEEHMVLVLSIKESDKENKPEKPEKPAKIKKEPAPKKIKSEKVKTKKIKKEEKSKENKPKKHKKEEIKQQEETYLDKEEPSTPENQGVESEAPTALED